MGFVGRYLHIFLPLLILLGGVALRIIDPGPIVQLRLSTFDLFNQLSPRVYTPPPLTQQAAIELQSEFQTCVEGGWDPQIAVDGGHPGGTFDWLTGGGEEGRLFASCDRLVKSAPVRIIDIDDDSLEKLGQWPWSRATIAELVERLTAAGAGAIVFDVVFAEQDRTSPAAVLPLWAEAGDLPELEALAARKDALPDPDQSFADVLRRDETRVVTGFVLTNGKMPRRPVSRVGWAKGGDAPEQFIPGYPGAVANLTLFEESATGNGSFNMVPDADGVVRRVPTMVSLIEADEEGTLKAQLYPSLHQEALRVFQGASTIIVKASGASGVQSFGEKTGIVELRNGHAEIKTDSDGMVVLHQADKRPDRYIPAWRVLDPAFDPTGVAGHIVILGPSAAGLLDLRATPLDPALPGVEMHAQVLEQILLGHFMQRPDWATGAEVLYLFVLGLLLLFLLPIAGARGAAVLAILAIALAIGFSWYAYTELLFQLDAVYPSIIVVLIFLTSVVTLFLRSEQEKAKVRDAFGMYLSPDLVEQLADHPEKLALGGEMKDMSILFMDVRGFTTISEQFDAVGLTRFINRFLTPMTGVIMEQRGTIDKYMGDCIMAFWNAPLDDERHAHNAMIASLRMIETRDSLNADLKREAEEEDRKYIPLNVGIGVNTGNVCVGNMGSDQRFDYSVLGDDVNLASRLEGQSKTYGVDVVIGENTDIAVRDEFATLELDLIQVKGKTKPVRIFCLFGDHDLLKSDGFKKLRAAHDGMMNSYRAQRWDQCQQLIDLARGLAGGRLDGLYDLYVERMTDYRANPPGVDWDGVFVATSK